MSVSDSVYKSAVKGRQEFRQALRIDRRKLKVAMKIVDAYGIALLMIREGVSDPSHFAGNALDGVVDELKELRK